MSASGEKTLSPHKINIFGRKRYSTQTEADDYIDYNLDDLWNSIGKLWIVTALIGIIACYSKKRKESEKMYLTDEGLSEIEKVADKQKNVALLFLIDIYRMLKTLLKEQNNASNGSNSGTDSSNDSKNQD